MSDVHRSGPAGRTEPANPADHHGGGTPRRTPGTVALAIGALGVVFGDIGTSPLYAFREAIQHQHLHVDDTSTLGLASLAFWVLVLVISVKYIGLVMRAENHGEGGILALTALVMRTSTRPQALVGLVLLGVFGTALLYGDGLITPAISVLSAVEGFDVASDAFEPVVLPLACAILLALFLVQRRGTGAIGRVFGPVMMVWFTTLGVLGINQIRKHPDVLRAVSPTYIVQFFAAEPMKAFLALGSIFLVVTGGEALYADMGHFGRRPIALVWYTLVMPGLVLNYFGQAALLASNQGAVDNPFYRMAPSWGLWPLAVLATMASVIASQALISGAFSMTAQAVQLDYLPRVAIRHTSGEQHGQVYVPLVNWALMAGCIGLVLAFRTSAALASAYGIAVTSVMVITTILIAVVARHTWQWSKLKTALAIGPLLLIDSAFLAANVPKIPHGGWFPLFVALGLVVQMTTWRRGRQLVAARIHRAERPISDVVAGLDGITRVDGTAVFLFKDALMAPPALLNNLRHNKVLHRTTIVLSVTTDEVPRVAPEDRYDLTVIADGVYHVNLHFGFMEDATVPATLALVDFPDGTHVDIDDATYFIGRESIVAGKVPGMNPLREQLFVLLNRGADSASRFFDLPAYRVFEVGSQVEL